MRPVPASSAASEDSARATRLGILLILLGMMAISINDATFKGLSGTYPLHQMVFLRSAIALPLIFAVLMVEGGPRLLRTATPGLHALRALLIVIANVLFFAGLSTLPLATATALFFVAPLFITLLAIPVLGERVGMRRLAALLVGFLGVVVMMAQGRGDGPEQALPIWALSLPVLAAACYAGMQVLTRKLGVASSASAMAIYIQGMFLIVSAVFFLVVGDGRYATQTDNPALQFLFRAWVWPAPQDWKLVLLIGIMGGGIGYCLSQAYRLGPPATIASYEYVALPLAIFWGFMLWGDVPSLQTLAGIALIVGAGLYVFLRERRRSRPTASRRPQRRL